MMSKFKVIQGTEAQIEEQLNKLIVTHFVKVVSTCINQEGFLVTVLYLKEHKDENS